jgi:hypothetical protein
MMIFASCPPSSITAFTSGWSFSTARVTALTSCTKRAPSGSASWPEPLPVTKMRMSSASGKAWPMRTRKSMQVSGCRVSCRW